MVFLLQTLKIQGALSLPEGSCNTLKTHSLGVGTPQSVVALQLFAHSANQKVPNDTSLVGIAVVQLADLVFVCA